MAIKQVAARTEGDMYQGLFFWKHAAALLRPHTKVQRVVLEHDPASGADDVAVFYEPPGIDAGGWKCTADFYQIKYHVDRRDTYSSETLIATPKSTRSSILQRLSSAYQSMSGEHPGLRINLASNWTWAADDPLAKSLRENDGSLPDEFFAGSSKSRLGLIREKWRRHLALQKSQFHGFCQALRLQVNHFGRRDFRELVHQSLEVSGLVIPDRAVVSDQYDSLTQQLIVNGIHDFDRETFQSLCQQEGLMCPARMPSPARPPVIAIRSYMRFAERIEDEAQEFVCVSEHFEGRHPRAGSSWRAAADKTEAYFADPERRSRLVKQETHILLECHSSLAFFAGYELSRNSGCQVYPIQKPGRTLWKPSTLPSTPSTLWCRDDVPLAPEAVDTAVALSVSHDIADQVLAFLAGPDTPKVQRLVTYQPTTGVSAASIVDANHAVQLATSLVGLWRSLVRPKARIHLFASAPNGFLFFLGQFRQALGPLALYEFDLDQSRASTYEVSLLLPR